MTYQPVNPCTPQDTNPPEVEDLFPGGSTPSNRIDSLSHLCSYGLTQLVMQGALRQVLVQHFADPRNILNATLRTRIEERGGYTTTPASAIYIESLHNWRPEMTESRPGLLIKEHDWEWKQAGIGDMLDGDYRSGRMTFAGLWQGAHTIFALAEEGAEAQMLATEVAKVLLWFRQNLMDQLGLLRFVPVSIGAVAALEESTENYVVPVNVAYVAEEIWWTQVEAPRLKRIEFRTSEVLAAY